MEGKLAGMMQKNNKMVRDCKDDPQMLLDVCADAVQQNLPLLLKAAIDRMKETGLTDEVLNMIIDMPGINAHHRRWKRLLHLAAGYIAGGGDAARRELVEMLLANGANPMLQNNIGAIPLHVASYLGHDDIVKLLVEHAVQSLLVADSMGCLPLSLACTHGRVSTVKVLLATFEEAAAAGRIEPISKLQLYQAARVACSASTPDHLHEQCLDLLISAGLDVNVVGLPTSPIDDMEPLVMSCCTNSDGKYAQNMLGKLLQKGAQIDMQASDGFTALNFACEKGHVKLAKMLLEAGADPTITDKLHQSPVLSALYNDKNACADLAFAACRERSERLGDPTILKQAEADVASFEAAPKHDGRTNHGVDPDEMLKEGELHELIEGRTITEDTDELLGEECIICMRDFCKCDRIAKLKCGHQFHSLCVVGHVEVNKPNCPMCRAHLRGPDFNVHQAQMERLTS